MKLRTPAFSAGPSRIGRAIRPRAYLAMAITATMIVVSPAIASVTADAAPKPAAGKLAWKSVEKGPDGAWHRLVKVSGKTWLRVFATFPAPGRSELQIHRSVDNARTWTPLSTVADGQRLVDNGFLFKTPKGDLLLSGRNNVLESSYKISQWRSTDGGKSWKREADIAASTKGLWEPSYHVASDGRIVAMWSDETYPNRSQVIAQSVSDDDGKSWGSKTAVVSDGPKGRPGMQSVVKTASGKYLMAFEVCGTQECAVHSKTSSNGVSWPKGIGEKIPGHFCGPFLTALTTGRILLTSCRVSDDDHTTPVSSSIDNGETWTKKAPAFTDADQYGFWPAFYQIGPNEVAAVSGARMRFGSLSGTTTSSATAKKTKPKIRPATRSSASKA